MDIVIDTSIWIDFLRPKTPLPVRRFCQNIILSGKSHIIEAVRFELLRCLSQKNRVHVEAALENLPMLSTSKELWSKATELGQVAQSQGIHCGPLDLLIAQSCIDHTIHLATFDRDFVDIARVSKLKLKYFDKKQLK